jgi:hypothetical protein
MASDRQCPPEAQRAYEEGYAAGIEAAAKLVAAEAGVNDRGWPRTISLAIVELLRTAPSGSGEP